MDPVTVVLVLLSLLGMVYLVWALAIVCDDYLMPALEEICDLLCLSPDAASATFLAFGSSSPEIFINTFGAATGDSELSLSGLLGGAIISIALIPAVCVYFLPPGADGGLVLSPRTLLRDLAFMCGGFLAVLILQYHSAAEFGAVAMVLAYPLYVAVVLGVGGGGGGGGGRGGGGGGVAGAGSGGGGGLGLGLEGDGGMSDLGSALLPAFGGGGGGGIDLEGARGGGEMREISSSSSSSSSAAAAPPSNPLAAGDLGAALSSTTPAAAAPSHGDAGSSSSSSSSSSSTSAAAELAGATRWDRFADRCEPLRAPLDALFCRLYPALGGVGSHGGSRSLRSRACWRSFGTSIAFVAAQSFGIIKLAEFASRSMGVSACVAGVTVLGVLMELPDLIACVSLAKRGLSGAVVSAAIGAQVMVATIGIGLPSLVQAMRGGAQDLTTVVDGVGPPIIALSLVTVLFLGITMGVVGTKERPQLTKRGANWMIGAYAVAVVTLVVLALADGC
jgi:Ca2+/Na+ antiporter